MKLDIRIRNYLLFNKFKIVDYYVLIIHVQNIEQLLIAHLSHFVCITSKFYLSDLAFLFFNFTLSAFGLPVAGVVRHHSTFSSVSLHLIRAGLLSLTSHIILSLCILSMCWFHSTLLLSVHSIIFFVLRVSPYVFVSHHVSSEFIHNFSQASHFSNF